MKTSIIIGIILVTYGLLPHSLNSFWRSPQPEDLVITGQACGCPCPQARVLMGKLPIPDSILIENPEIYKSQMNLSGNTPFDPFVFEIATAQILVEGSVVGVDTVLCSISKCELAPEFQVDNWQLLSYVPKFLSWHAAWIFLYKSLITVLCLWAIFVIVYKTFPTLTVDN